MVGHIHGECEAAAVGRPLWQTRKTTGAGHLDPHRFIVLRNPLYRHTHKFGDALAGVDLGIHPQAAQFQEGLRQDGYAGIRIVVNQQHCVAGRADAHIGGGPRFYDGGYIGGWPLVGIVLGKHLHLPVKAQYQ